MNDNTEIEILPFGRFKYPQPYSGSFRNMSYRIVHPKPEEGAENLIYVDVWPGPYCYEKTDEDKKTRTTFPYGEEGYNEIVPYLTAMYMEKFQ